MKNKEYNWWTDPKNKEEIEKRSWWNWPENKETFPLPISVNNHDGIWVATFNNETEKILGEEIHGVFNLQGIEVYYHIEIDTKAMKMKLLVAFLDQKGHQEILARLFQTFLCLFKENVCQTALYI